MSKRHPWDVLAVVFVLMMSSCASEDSVVELGTIEHYEMQPEIEVPDVVRAGQELRLVVMTYGGGCVAHESTQVLVSDPSADVHPFDRRQIPSQGELCTDELKTIPHESTLVFPSTGEKLIRVHGRRTNEAGTETIVTIVPLRVE